MIKNYSSVLVFNLPSCASFLRDKALPSVPRSAERLDTGLNLALTGTANVVVVSEVGHSPALQFLN